jgi:hypothetical protein
MENIDTEELTAVDGKHMYCVLLRGMDAALERLKADAPVAARHALETSMDEAEEYYISRDGRKN